jgi:hypothetical protein
MSFTPIFMHLATGAYLPLHRVSSIGGRRAPARPGDAGYKFLIRLNPSGSLAMALAYRPRGTGNLAFTLPLALQCSALAAPATSVADLPQAAGAAAASGGGRPGEGTAPRAVLAVPVAATGMQPLVVLSKTSFDFGPCVVGRGGMQRPSSYTAEVYVRNNTDADLEVRGGAAVVGGGAGLLL